MRHSGKAFRYTIVTGGLWAGDIVAFAVLHGFLGVSTTIILVRVVASVLAIALHKWFTFGSIGDGLPSIREIGGYAVTWGAKLLMILFGVNAIITITDWDPVVVKILVDFFVFALSYAVLDRVFSARATDSLAVAGSKTASWFAHIRKRP